MKLFAYYFIRMAMSIILLIIIFSLALCAFDEKYLSMYRSDKGLLSLQSVNFSAENAAFSVERPKELTCKRDNYESKPQIACEQYGCTIIFFPKIKRCKKIRALVSRRDGEVILFVGDHEYK